MNQDTEKKLRAALADLAQVEKARQAAEAAVEHLDFMVLEVAARRNVTREQIADKLGISRRLLYKRYPTLGTPPPGSTIELERKRRLQEIDTELAEIAKVHPYPSFPSSDPRYGELVKERDQLMYEGGIEYRAPGESVVGAEQDR